MLDFRLTNWRKSIIATVVSTLILPHMTAFAEITTYESFINLNPLKIEITGETAGEQMGSAIVSGDFNGDGVDDLAISSPFASIDQGEFNGKVLIFFGKKKMKIRENSFNTMSPDVAFYGASSGDQLGSSLAVGDFNNDGIDDLAIGAFNAYDKNKNNRVGKVYVMKGRNDWVDRSFIFPTTKPDATFTGVDTDEGFGMTLSTVDINNDDVDDLVIGSPFSSSPKIKRSGMVYAFFGGVDFMSTRVYSSNKSNLKVYGNAMNERFGSSISGGKILGKYTNLVVGAYAADHGDKSQSGKVYLYKSAKDLPAIMDSPSVIFSGTKTGEWFGFKTVVADIDNDKKDDLLVSSFPYNGDAYDSKVSVFYSKDIPDKKSSFIHANKENAGVILQEPRGEALIGASIIADDFNKNGYTDIIIGAPGISDSQNNMTGDVYMILDEAIKKTSVYSADGQSVSATVRGRNTDDWFGFSIAVLDFNRDGHKDLVVGARYSDAGTELDNGKVFILFGKSEPFGDEKTVVDLEDRPISRGAVIHAVVEKLDLKTKKKDVIDSCHEYKEFCLFNFMAMSLYNDIQLEPSLILYPDVPENHRYYEDITIGTMLGLVNGFVSQQDTPFYPNRSISRINALKIILTAADLVKFKYRFALLKELGGYEKLITQYSYFRDIDPKVYEMWWVPRYTNFALRAGIVPKNRYFRPNENITIKEFNSMLEKTVEYLNSLEQDEEVKS